MSKRVSPFELPRGVSGRVAGWLMASTNARVNAFAMESLRIQPGDHVLEIGFGPGTALGRLAQLAGKGTVAGVDPSELMGAQAGARNRELIAAGRLELRVGGVSALPFETTTFNAVLSVNTLYFWPDPPRDAVEVRRVMKPGGRLALAFRVGRDGDGVLGLRTTAGRRSVDEVLGWLRAAGFSDPRAETRKLGFMNVACVVATA